MKRAFTCASLFLSTLSLSFGQSAASPSAFTSATIHASKSGAEPGGGGLLPGGKVELLGKSLKDLIMLAYDLDADMVVGGPAWLGSERFDVAAQGPATAPFNTLLSMLQSLLASRFKLAIHREDRPVDVYALTLAPGGPKMTKVAKSARSGCNAAAAEGFKTLNCQGTSMAELAVKLREVAPAYLDHPVVDLTGLKGSYDFMLTWSPKLRKNTEKSGKIPLSQAVEQLGLKMNPQKQPRSVVVVDRAEPPAVQN